MPKARFFLFYLLSLKNTDISLEIRTKCLQNLSSWMPPRKLKVNPDKADIIVSNFLEMFFPTRLLAQEVTPPSAGNIGIGFDIALHFESHNNMWYISGLVLSYTWHA